MSKLFRANDVGRTDHGWLQARHHFSFAEYYDASRIGIGPLRVWNDDRIAAGTGFPMHPHRDMEIITYVKSGAITHEDSLGNTGRTQAGDVQVMSAGTGIVHSEYNLEEEDTTLFQIWIKPDQNGYEPRWQNTRFPGAEQTANLRPLASGEERYATTDALMIHQDATVYGGNLSEDQRLTHIFEDGRSGYLVVASGRVRVDRLILEEGDGLDVQSESEITLMAETDTEIVLVDVPYPWSS